MHYYVSLFTRSKNSVYFFYLIILQLDVLFIYVTGEVKLTATADIDTGYILYAAARDSGDPSQSTSTGATVRIDTYDPEAVILNYYLGISMTTYLSKEELFLSQLTSAFQGTYPTAQAKRWCVAAYNDT